MLNLGFVKHTSPLSSPDIKQVFDTAMHTAMFKFWYTISYQGFLFYCPISSLFQTLLALATKQKSVYPSQVNKPFLNLCISSPHHMERFSLYLELIFGPVKHVCQLLCRLCSIQTELSLYTWPLLLSHEHPDLTQHNPLLQS